MVKIVRVYQTNIGEYSTNGVIYILDTDETDVEKIKVLIEDAVIKDFCGDDDPIDCISVPRKNMWKVFRVEVEPAPLKKDKPVSVHHDVY